MQIHIDKLHTEIKEACLAWTPDLAGAEGPIYAALADAMARAIEAGVLAPGERLPSQRALAGRLGVDLTTITRAYAEAARRGLIASEDRRGSFVRARPGMTTEADPADEEAASGMNMPPEPEGGVLRAAIAAGTAEVLARWGGAALHYRPSGGGEADRAAGAEFLSRLIPDTSPDQVVAAAGAQNALHAVCAALPRAGGALAAGEFAYPGLLAAARRLGATVVPIAMDAEGLIPDALDEAARRHPLKAVYVVPTNDNPTTATMGAARRAAIAELAERHGLAIVEDDAYGRLPEDPPAPIAALAPARTWHIASLSKCLSPMLRVAYVRAPDVRGALALAADVHETAVMAPPLGLALARLWQADGTLARLIEAVRHEGQARQRIARALFPAALARPEGYHLWLKLPDGVTAAAIAGNAQAAGLPIAPGAAFAADGRGPYEALRVALGGGRTRERLQRDLRRLDALIAGAARRDHILV